MEKHKDYFEGTLQLRGVYAEVVEFAIHEIEKKEDGNVAKIEELDNGVDIYMAPQKFLRSLGTKLQQHFGGQVIVSKKLHTKNRLTSKEVYRVNMLFRMPKFKKGSIIEYKGEKVKITAMHKKVNVKNVKTGKKLVLNFKDLMK